MTKNKNKISFNALSPSGSQRKTELLGLTVRQGSLLSPLGSNLDKSWNGLVSRIMKKEGFHGKVGETKIIYSPTSQGPEAVLLLGVGEEEKAELNLLRRIGAWLVKAGNRIQAKTISIEDVLLLKKETSESRAQAFAEGCLMAHHRFEAYKKPASSLSDEKKKGVSVSSFEVWTHPQDEKAMGRGFKTGEVFAESTTLARELINTPACDMTPTRMAEEAKRIGKLPRLSVKIYDEKDIQKMGMGCYWAVAKGSIEPPRFIHLHYKPAGKIKKTIAIIGKGVTFDSGGLSLKTPPSTMETMKDDMSGAAAMLGVMQALSTLQPSIEVHGISAVTENMPSGSAVKPGDIARSMNGKTVEILNTDAEGRLTLADAMTYALEQKPDLVIDFATLTGACVIALGELCSAILGNNQKLIDQLIACGKTAGENLWQLPLVEEYKEELKSSIADLKNVGGRWGGTINGALFIQEFTDDKIPWAHIDIAGPSWTEKEQDYCTRGGTGHLTRTLLHFILSL